MGSRTMSDTATQCTVEILDNPGDMPCARSGDPISIPAHQEVDGIWDGAADATWSLRTSLSLARRMGFLAIPHGWEPIAWQEWRDYCYTQCLPMVVILGCGDGPACVRIDLETTASGYWRDWWRERISWVRPECSWPGPDHTTAEIAVPSRNDALALAVRILASGDRGLAIPQERAV